ncbi:unnamed protein product [Protopolystoma xenopodis]|uniref:Tubulin alpha chain n=1 Tax=Protopolystoma xenopodis TaxID=117903 RepID=A0A448WAG5_9PLAT|nr:unnamed protein product [Protopolystoma xenopodis]
MNIETDEIRLGVYRGLFNPDSLISGFEDSASNFTRGFHSVAQTLMGKTMNSIRHEVERTNNLQALFLYHSYSGGTGAGVTCRILQALELEYPKTPKLQLTVFPGNTMCASVVEPYNTVLCCSVSDPQSDVTILVDNEALVKMCTNLLKIDRPVYTNLNRIMSQVC